MSRNEQSSVDAYCNGCNAFICDELVTFEETCSNCGTQIEYFEDKMSNNKLSSVEWFAKESWKLRVALEDGKISVGEYANKYYQMKEQAKAMHKEEIRKAYCYGEHYKDTKLTTDYYNETFGGNND